MGFVKVLKTPQYFSRYQVKLRRRRQCKTNYHSRRAMLINDKDKYNSPKYRLVVRITNTKIIAQIVTPTLAGDRIITSAESTELPNFGIETGLKNYAAGYCTGLLVARRHLKKLGMDSLFTGAENRDGSEYHVEESTISDRRPFKCALDIGLRSRTKGSRIFGVMKGAVDAGLHVPHSVKRFPGYKIENDEGTYDASFHRDMIYGLPIANYMKMLKSENPDKYQRQFSQYIKLGISPDELESIYEKAHKKIIENPDRKVKPKQQYTYQRKGSFIHTPNGIYRRDKKLDATRRRARAQEKLRLVAQTLL